LSLKVLYFFYKLYFKVSIINEKGNAHDFFSLINSSACMQRQKMIQVSFTIFPTHYNTPKHTLSHTLKHTHTQTPKHADTIRSRKQFFISQVLVWSDTYFDQLKVVRSLSIEMKTNLKLIGDQKWPEALQLLA